MYLNFDFQAMNYSMNVDTNFRALGVQGNPITSSMALLLALPFLFELKNPFFRFGSIGFVIFAVSYTGSRTILILLLPLVVMFFFRNRKLFVPTSLLGLLGLAFGLYLISAANVSQLVNSDNVFVTRLLQPSDSDVDSLDQRLLRLRESVDIFSREEPLNQLIGSGPRSTLTLLSAF